MKECNRPYGAADVSANIKNVVSKSATQKVLATLAERGTITQKVYGKTCYYVANQSECEDMSLIQLDALEARCNMVNDRIKDVATQQKILNAGEPSPQSRVESRIPQPNPRYILANVELARIRSTPDDTQLGKDIASMQAEIDQLEAALTPLRAGSALLSDEEVRELDREWLHWRSEWMARKKVFSVAWSTATESLSASESPGLAEELGQFEA
ncbi:hypothetical protein FRB90_009309 [Tulasnella sp. 427]|nr:hypothetical protein FRB90_009309 [Tulasnella sp. 427]